MNDLLSIVDGGDCALLVLLDLSSAFDTIDHSLLLRRLHDQTHLDQTVLQWFSSYLAGRTQEVLVGQCRSPSTQLLYGVPQGSVLGPLLFSLYTMELAAVIDTFSVHHHFFADDTELYSYIPSDPDSAARAICNIEDCCSEIKVWMDTNKLKLNEEKTEALLCGSQSRIADVPVSGITVGGAEIPFSSSVKILGVHFDTELSLEEHVSNTVKTCFFHIRSLSKIRPYVNRTTANAIAVSLVLSRIDYCNSLLVGLPQNQLKRIQMAQNAAARVVTKTRKADHITPILRELHWLPVEKRAQHKFLTLVHKSQKDQAPEYLSELLTEYKPTRSLRSASQHLLCVPGVKDIKTKRYGQRTFRHLAPTLYNSLPQSLKALEVQGFRSALKTHLFGPM